MSVRNFLAALPYWISLLLLPCVWLAATRGGAFLLLLPIGASIAAIVADTLVGRDTSNADPATPTSELFWHRMITIAWVPIQAILLFGAIYYVGRHSDLDAFEIWALSVGLGFVCGAIGIVYAHELMHQKNRFERWLGDILMCMTLYGHFRTEHLLVHHRYVGTPRDAVTARYNEGYYRFFRRVLWGSLVSAFTAEKTLLARRNFPWWHRTNPFWRYAALEGAMIALALVLGGWTGLWMFLTSSFVAVGYLEAVNYVEHYGLSRKHLGGGKYEHVRPHHSWNSDQRVSNWLLINLQRHSDHHYNPDRRYPLLQTYTENEAPLLPSGYPVIVVAAFIPPLWRRLMNPRVRKWRAMYYPEITDWEPYKRGTSPLPR